MSASTRPPRRQIAASRDALLGRRCYLSGLARAGADQCARATLAVVGCRMGLFAARCKRAVARVGGYHRRARSPYHPRADVGCRSAVAAAPALQRFRPKLQVQVRVVELLLCGTAEMSVTVSASVFVQLYNYHNYKFSRPPIPHQQWSRDRMMRCCLDWKADLRRRCRREISAERVASRRRSASHGCLRDEIFSTMQ